MMNGNKSYLLSFTALFNAEKEYILSVNCHQSVEVHNNYVLSSPVWNTYDGLIMWDLKEGVKKLTGSILFPMREGEIPFADAHSPSVFTSSGALAYMSVIHEQIQSQVISEAISNEPSTKSEIIYIVKETAKSLAANILEKEVNHDNNVLGQKIDQNIVSEPVGKFEKVLSSIQDSQINILESGALNHDGVEELFELTSKIPNYMESVELLFTSATNNLYGENLIQLPAYKSDYLPWEGNSIDAMNMTIRKDTIDALQPGLLYSFHKDTLDALSPEVLDSLRLLEIMYGESIVEQIKAEYETIIEAVTIKSTAAYNSSEFYSYADYIENSYFSTIQDIHMSALTQVENNLSVHLLLATFESGSSIANTESFNTELINASTSSFDTLTFLHHELVESSTINGSDIYLHVINKSESVTQSDSIELNLEQADQIIGHSVVIMDDPESGNVLPSSTGTIDNVDHASVLMDSFGIVHLNELSEVVKGTQGLIHTISHIDATYSSSDGIIDNPIQGDRSITIDGLSTPFEKAEVGHTSLGELEGIENSFKYLQVIGNLDTKLDLSVNEPSLNGFIDNDYTKATNPPIMDGVTDTYLEQAISDIHFDGFTDSHYDKAANPIIVNGIMDIYIEQALWDIHFDGITGVEIDKATKKAILVEGVNAHLEIAGRSFILTGLIDDFDLAETTLSSDYFETKLINVQQKPTLFGDIELPIKSSINSEALAILNTFEESQVQVNSKVGFIELYSLGNNNITLYANSADEDHGKRKKKLKTRISIPSQFSRKRKKYKTKILKHELAISLGHDPGPQESPTMWLITGKPYAWNNRNWAKTR